MSVDTMACALALAALSAACSDATERPATCAAQQGVQLGSRRQAILYGGDGSQYLGLAVAEQAAIVRLESGTSTTSPCSGTLIAPHVVLTAKHCLEAEELTVLTQDESGSKQRQILSIDAHPSLDLALLELDAEVTDEQQVSAILPHLAEVDETWLGKLVEIAGYGAYEDGSGRLQFAVEELQSMTDEALVVDGRGNSGACFGDSGGPLLVRAEDGRPRVAGVLGIGSTTCLGLDEYTRTDVVADWLEPVVTFEPAMACGNINGEGQCLWGRAVWCDDGALRSETCAETTPCGWLDGSGFRCIDPASDACGGFDAAGACEGGAAKRCERGALVSEACAACSSQCARQPATGKAACRPVP